MHIPVISANIMTPCLFILAKNQFCVKLVELLVDVSSLNIVLFFYMVHFNILVFQPLMAQNEFRSGKETIRGIQKQASNVFEGILNSCNAILASFGKCFCSHGLFWAYSTSSFTVLRTDTGKDTLNFRASYLQKIQTQNRNFYLIWHQPCVFLFLFF